MIAARRWKKGDPARGGHPGNRAKPARQLLLEGGAALGVVPDGRQVHVERQDTIDAKSEVDLLQAVETRQQHAGANQQRQRKRELGGGQAAAEPSLPACARGDARLLSKRLDGRNVRETQRGRDAERDGRRHRDRQRQIPAPQGRIRPRRAAARASRPRRCSTLTPIRATASPISPPRPARSRLSTRSWRTSRRLPEPSAERVANSWTRPVARASTRLATFTQATRSTSPTATNNRLQRAARGRHEILLQRNRDQRRSSARLESVPSSTGSGSRAPPEPARG